MADEYKLAHLGFIQGVIDRMGSNSFNIKGWVIALIGAAFALSMEKLNSVYLFFGAFGVLVFWMLDAFYLYQEKLYRVLYLRVATNRVAADLSMDASICKGEVSFLGSVLSIAIWPFYLTMSAFILSWFVFGFFDFQSLFGECVASD
ncbi:hypothetical protein RTH74_22640 [Pseudomonas sp. zfem001]|uniref:hypothetical protein n=1 Tax=Pseudomonas sp. zfem001 TaxID=3078196 RepID=UPI002928A73E|nr:hypothetical protein [Pseudomonas sp. zfem001]MDU9410407.1 hypothetical protein [Pseudomonas sp. zfem001]